MKQAVEALPEEKPVHDSRMTPRERFLTAIRNEQPDMVPVVPDISNMIPCRLTGKPFWDVYLFQNPPLWKAYIEAVKHFGFEGWSGWAPDIKFKKSPPIKPFPRKISKSSIVGGITIETPHGDLEMEVTFRRGDPPATSGYPLKDITRDLKKVRWLLKQIKDVGFENAQQRKDELGELGVVGIGVTVPGFQGWVDFASLENLTYWYYDHRELIEELRELHHDAILKLTERILDFKPDLIDIAASGSITLQSPTIFRELSLPTLKVITKLAKEAGVPTMMHSCGKARDLVKICAEETDLNCINPLERPPLGDCDLKEIKQKYGHRIALMGNLPTTTLMLNGTPEEVEKECIQAIEDAAKGGGFILSTGDQCGRDTPFENIERMIQTARSYGRYM
ncbi:MAG: uroporphyrinogen decarboxylase family protein [bacterium]